MKASILNRDFTHPADGWYQIEAKGNHPNKAANVIQVIDADAITSIVNRFNADAEAGKLSHGNEMLIDIEHFKDDPSKETRAYGWLQELQNREDGIYAKIRWSRTGKEAVDGGDYRFFSTEYDPQDVKILNKGKTPLVRPLRLDGLTLTNMNNNKGQKPITNRAPQTDAQPERKTMNQVAIKLGLRADASEESVLAEVVRLLNRVETLTPFEEENKTLKNRNNALETEQCAVLLDLCGVTEEKIRNRMTPALAGLKTREDRMAYLADFGHKPVEKKDSNPNGRTLNRQDTRSAQNSEMEKGADDEQEMAQKITNRANELKGQNSSRPFEECWNQARREINAKK